MTYQPNPANKAKWEETEAKVIPILSSIQPMMTKRQLVHALAEATGLKRDKVRQCLRPSFYEYAFAEDELDRRIARERAARDLADMTVYGQLF